MKNQKTKGNDTKQNIPFVTKKYQQRAMGHCRTKEEKNEILLYAAIWMDLEGIMPYEVS